MVAPGGKRLETDDPAGTSSVTVCWPVRSVYVTVHVSASAGALPKISAMRAAPVVASAPISLRR